VGLGGVVGHGTTWSRRPLLAAGLMTAEAAAQPGGSDRGGQDAAAPRPFPGHDGGAFTPVPCRTVAEWPVGTFLENIVVTADGAAALVTVHTANRIEQIALADGATRSFAEFPLPVAGLAFDDSGTIWVSAGEPGKAPGSIWRIPSGGGVPQRWATIEEAVFLNGCAVHGDQLLVAESILGKVYAVSLAAPDRVTTWLADPLLASPAPPTPGANGVKLFAGRVSVSCTARNLLLRAALGPTGMPGSLAVVAERLRLDDFAFDAAGTLYAATHPANSILRLAPEGTRHTLAGPAQGVFGPTAVAFGRGAGDTGALYAVTNGGLLAPLDGVVRPARLVRLEAR